MVHNTIDSNYESLFRHIVTNHRKFYALKISEFTVRFFAIACILFLIFFLINMIFDVAGLLRAAFLTGFVVWFGIYSIRYIFPRIKEIFFPSTGELFQSAKRIGMGDETVRDALLNFLQLYQSRSSQGSNIVRKMALSQLFSRFERISFKNRFPRNRLWKYSKPIFLSVLFGSVSFISFPGTSELVLKRMLFPWKHYSQSLPIKLKNMTGDVTILKNNGVMLKGKYEGIAPQQLFLVVGDSLQKKESGRPGSGGKMIPITASGNRNFQYSFQSVSRSFEYRFLAKMKSGRFTRKEALSPIGKVQVRERPIIRNLQLKIFPPGYTRNKIVLLPPNEGEIAALKGSKAELRIEVNKQLQQAFVLFDDSSKIPLKITGSTASGSFRVLKRTSYTIHVFDVDSIRNGQPVEYGVYALTDELPFAEIKQPGVDVDLQNELDLPLFVELHDDFGFSGLWLKGTIHRVGSESDSAAFKLKLPYKMHGRGDAFSEIRWNLKPFYMVPDDYVSYFVEVWDNDQISGPKFYRTRSYTVRLPSVMELLDTAEQNQEEHLDEIKDLSAESRKIKEKLEEIERELKREQKVDWERKEEIKDQLKKQQQVNEKLSDVQKKLHATIEKIDQSKMLSPETLKKYFDLQKMFKELANKELQEAMRKLNESLEKVDPGQIQKALEDFQLSLEEFEKKIERTYELFKRVQLEQKMDELVKLAEKITEEQSQVNKGLDSLKKSDSDNLNRFGKKEETLEKLAEYLKQDIQKTNQTYEELMKKLSDLLEQAKKFMEEKKISQDMRQMQNMMNPAQKEDAKNTGKMIKSNMEQLQSYLQMAKNSMMKKQKQELADQMQKTIRDVLETSFEQESLIKQAKKMSSASSKITAIARKQLQTLHSTRQIIRQLIAISNETFFLPPQMSRLMSQILAAMQGAIGQFENRNPKNAGKSGEKALSGLNQALLSLQNAMNQMSQSTSASGFQEFMQQLQQMVGQQGQVNQQAMSLFQKNQQGGRLSLSSEALARLAAQQEAVRQSLGQLNKQAGSRRDVLGRLDELADEMKEVVKDLQARKLDRKVIQRQEKILSRLLDAQKSVREKEYSKERRAEWEKNVLVKSPPQLREELLRKEDVLRKELMKALQEGYSTEYREFIKNYFELLSRQNQEKTEPKD